MGRYFNGIFGFIRAFSGIFRYGLVGHLMISGIVGLAVGAGIFYLGYRQAHHLGDWLTGVYPFSFGAGWIENISVYLSGAILLVVGLLLYKYLVMAILSPLMSFVSEKVEFRLTSSRVEGFSLTRLFQELIRGIRLAIGNLIRESFLLLLIFILGLVLPILAPVLGVLAYLIQAYYVGFGALDYFMERRYGVAMSKKMAKDHRSALAGIGSAFIPISLVPVFGWIFAPIMATIAATEYAIDQGLDLDQSIPV